MTELHKKGYDDVQITAPAEYCFTEEENRQTNPVKFLDSNNNVLYEQPMQINTMEYAKRNDCWEKVFIRVATLINGPMDFSKKNRISLEDLHNILISLVFPKKLLQGKRFNITEEDRNFVLKYMSQLPTESTYPPYACRYGKLLACLL